MTGDTIRQEDLIEWSGLPVGKTCALCGNGPALLCRPCAKRIRPGADRSSHQMARAPGTPGGDALSGTRPVTRK